MIILRDQKVCIVTPPKCGTTSLHHSLCPPGLHMEGPQLDGSVSTHTYLLPFVVTHNIKDYTILMLTRHPFRRMLSLYGHWKKWWKRPDGTFEEFVKEVLIPQRCYFLCSPVSSWVHLFQRENQGIKWETFKFEQREHICDKYKIKQKISHLHKSEHGTLEEEYTQELLDIAILWGKYDFEYFGYKKEAWWNVRP